LVAPRDWDRILAELQEIEDEQLRAINRALWARDPLSPEQLSEWTVAVRERATKLDAIAKRLSGEHQQQRAEAERVARHHQAQVEELATARAELAQHEARVEQALSRVQEEEPKLVKWRSDLEAREQRILPREERVAAREQRQAELEAAARTATSKAHELEKLLNVALEIAVSSVLRPRTRRQKVAAVRERLAAIRRL
jgi:hypothetical protein